MHRILIILLIFCMPVFSAEYGVYSPNSYKLRTDAEERVLFILDFSNSMSEYLDGKRKVDHMLETLTKLLPSIRANTSVGLRVYGHKGGFSAFDAC
ncbi:hypothetical protein IJZ97_00270, partial [bacterium]|nr:hypothetical protein [bacterium]